MLHGKKFEVSTLYLPFIFPVPSTFFSCSILVQFLVVLTLLLLGNPALNYLRFLYKLSVQSLYKGRTEYAFQVTGIVLMTQGLYESFKLYFSQSNEVSKEISTSSSPTTYTDCLMQTWFDSFINLSSTPSQDQNGFRQIPITMCAPFSC